MVKQDIKGNFCAILCCDPSILRDWNPNSLCSQLLHVHAHAHACVCACVRARTHTHTYACVHLCMYIEDSG